MNSLSNNLIIETVRGDRLGYSDISKIWHLRNYPVRIIWEHNGVQNQIDDEERVFFFECQNDLLFVLYQGKTSSQITHPDNLLVYDLAGRVMKTISAPEFKSEEMKKIFLLSKLKHGFMDSLNKKENRIEVTVSNNDFFEIQYLDTDLLEFLPEAKFGGRY